MSIIISNLKYSSPDNSFIDMTVTGWLADPIPFTYHANDTAPLSLAVAPLLSGQTVAAYVAPAPTVPASVTRAQAKIQLSRAGLLSQVQTLVNASDAETQIWFTDAGVWERTNPKVLSLAAALSQPLTSTDIDNLFIAAAQIV